MALKLQTGRNIWTFSLAIALLTTNFLDKAACAEELSEEGPVAISESQPAEPASPKAIEISAEEKGLDHNGLQALFLTAYQAKDWGRSLVLAQEIQLRRPLQPENLYHLGLVYSQLQESGRAISKFRQALRLDPGLEPAAMALDFKEAQLFLKSDISSADWLFRWHHFVFRSLSAQWLFLLYLYTGITGAILWIRFVKRKKLAKLAAAQPPGAPIFAYLFSFLFVILLALFLFKQYVLSVPFATIVSEKVASHSAPTEKALTLFELKEGEQVIIEKKRDRFVMILAGTGLTGWVHENLVEPEEIPFNSER